MKKLLSSRKAKLALLFSAITSMLTVNAFAVGTSLLDTTATTTIQGFADNIMPTVVALIGILIPASLALWALGFGIKKGIAFLQHKANKAF